jgi:hypothetical protein
MNYTVSGSRHKLRAYCNVAPPHTFPFSLSYRDGSSALWTVSAQQWSVALSEFNPAGTTADGIVLEKFDGLIWNPIDTYNPTAPTFTGTLSPASQLTMTLRDILFHQVKIVVLDTKYQPTFTQKALPLVSPLPAGLYAFYYGPSADPNSPFFWQVSRSADYLAVNNFIGITSDFNDKARRRRGLI